jgi:zinc protease
LTLETIKNQKDSPVQLTYLVFQKLMFKHHPYGLPLIGSRESVQKITLGQIQKYYQKLLHPKNMVISAVGDFKTELLVDELAEAFSELKSGALYAPKVKKESRQKDIRKQVIRLKKQQAHVLLGFQAPTLTSLDHYPMQVLHHILAGQGGRLFLELRDKQSLAYTVTSWFIEGLDPGMFAVYIGTDPSKVDVAIAEIISELSKISSTLVSSEEIDRAKNYLVGNYELDLQRNSAIAGTLAFDELYGHGIKEFEEYPEKILKITAEEVLKAAKKYLTLNAYSLAVLRP